MISVSFLIIFVPFLIYWREMNKNLTLSKSDYQQFLEAPMHLWAHKHGQIQKQPTGVEIHIIKLYSKCITIASHYNQRKNELGNE